MASHSSARERPDSLSPSGSVNRYKSMIENPAAETDLCAAILKDWSRQMEPAIRGWPISYGLLDRVRISAEYELAFAFSLRNDEFAIVPLQKAIFVREPIFIESKYDTDALRQKLVKFASGEYGDFHEAPCFRSYKRPNSEAMRS